MILNNQTNQQKEKRGIAGETSPPREDKNLSSKLTAVQVYFCINASGNFYSLRFHDSLAGLFEVFYVAEL